MRRFVFFSLAMVLLLTASAVAQSTSAVLAAQWKLQEGSGTIANNTFPSGNSGTLSGDVALMSDADLTGAAEFWGVGQIMVPFSRVLEPAAGSVVAYIKADTPQDSDVLVHTSTMLARSYVSISGAALVYGLRIYQDGRVGALILNDDPAKSSPWTVAFTDAGVLTTGAWHQLAMTWDGGTLTIFVDGVRRAWTNYSPVPVLGLSYGGEKPLWFGRGTYWGVGTSHYFNGRMADIRLYKNALTANEVRDDWGNSGVAECGPAGQGGGHAWGRCK